MWAYIVIGILALALYIGNKIFFRVVNFIIIWTLKGARGLLWCFLWVFQKIDSWGRKKKDTQASAKKSPQEDREEDFASVDDLSDEIKEILRKNPDIKIKAIN